MATMVAPSSSPLLSSSSSSSIPIQENGSRNKRKFRTDPSLVELNALVPPMKVEYAGHDLFSAVECHGACDLCADPTPDSCRVLPELEFDDFQEPDWGEVTELELEEILLANLDAIFKSAIKTIASHGHAEEAAMSAVLRSRICYGSKDAGSNIVENGLAFLSAGQGADSSSRESFDEDLRNLEKCLLGEMVSVLREVRPFFSKGDALWCLLLSDMNVTHACAMEGDPLNVIGDDDTSCSSTCPQLEYQDNAHASISPTNPELNSSGPKRLNTMPPHPVKVVGIPNLSRGKLYDKNSNLYAGNGEMIPFYVQPELSCSTVSRAGGRHGHGGVSKRDSFLRQKSAHFENNYRSFGLKPASRAGKHNGLGGLMLDKKCKPLSGSSVISMKSASLKISKASMALKTPFSEGPNVSMAPSLVPTKNADLSLSPTPRISGGSDDIGIQIDKLRGYQNPQDKEDEALLKLLPRAREVQLQLQEWSDWAHKKVMQAAGRLSREKEELQALRREKEEVARLKREKRSLVENTRKNLLEMEIALSKVSNQVEEASATARRLESKNTDLRVEMESAKLHAAKSAADCQVVSRREMDILKRFQSWEREKVLVQEELSDGKRELSQIQQQVKQAKEFYDQIQAKWKLEETAKNESLVRAYSLRKEREQIETSGKAKENAERLKAETYSQRHKANVRLLEDRISELEAALRSGKRANGTFYIAEVTDSAEEVVRERECVMCLAEEISVLFLPCAHQVLCANCNELHVKQGLKECPSCRARIEQRIRILLVNY